MAEFDPATDETLMSVFDKADTDMYDNRRQLKGAQKQADEGKTSEVINNIV